MPRRTGDIADSDTQRNTARRIPRPTGTADESATSGRVRNGDMPAALQMERKEYRRRFESSVRHATLQTASTETSTASIGTRCTPNDSRNRKSCHKRQKTENVIRVAAGCLNLDNATLTTLKTIAPNDLKDFKDIKDFNFGFPLAYSYLCTIFRLFDKPWIHYKQSFSASFRV